MDLTVVEKYSNESILRRLGFFIEKLREE